jgi:hypothetical protein
VWYGFLREAMFWKSKKEKEDVITLNNDKPKIPTIYDEKDTRVENRKKLLDLLKTTKCLK